MIHFMFCLSGHYMANMGYALRCLQNFSEQYGVSVSEIKHTSLEMSIKDDNDSFGSTLFTLDIFANDLERLFIIQDFLKSRSLKRPYGKLFYALEHLKESIELVGGIKKELGRFDGSDTAALLFETTKEQIDRAVLAQKLQT